MLPELDPDVVVLAERPIDDPTNPVNALLDGERGRVPDDDDTARQQVLDRTSSDTVGALESTGYDVVIIEPVPVSRPDENTLECLAEGMFLDECRFVAPTAIFDTETAFRRLDDSSSSVWSLDLDAMACPYFPICDPLVDSLIVRRDETHFTGTFSESRGPQMGRLLESVGILR